MLRELLEEERVMANDSSIRMAALETEDKDNQEDN